MRNATPQTIACYRPHGRRALSRGARLLAARLVTVWLGLLLAAGAAARIDSRDEVIKLHLPVNLEGRQTVRLDRLAHEYYDIDLDDYVLREVVLETDGANHRRDAYATLQVGRARTGRTYLRDNLTSLQIPAYRTTKWRLSLGSGARAHGILLILQDRGFTHYHTLPHAGSTLGLGWYLSTRDYYYHDRYARPHFYNRFHRDHYGHQRGTWHGAYRLRYRDDHRRWSGRHRHDRSKRDERRDEHHADDKRQREHRQWRGNEQAAGRDQQRTRRALPRERNSAEGSPRLRGNHEYRRQQRAAVRERTPRQQPPRQRATRPDRNPERQRVERGQRRAETAPRRRAEAAPRRRAETAPRQRAETAPRQRAETAPRQRAQRPNRQRIERAQRQRSPGTRAASTSKRVRL